MEFPHPETVNPQKGPRPSPCRVWVPKLIFRVLGLALCITLIAIAAVLENTYIGIFAFACVAFPAIIGIIVNASEAVTMAHSRGHRVCHPAMGVALDGIIWLSLIPLLIVLHTSKASKATRTIEARGTSCYYHWYGWYGGYICTYEPDETDEPNSEDSGEDSSPPEESSVPDVAQESEEQEEPAEEPGEQPLPEEQSTTEAPPTSTSLPGFAPEDFFTSTSLSAEPTSSESLDIVIQESGYRTVPRDSDVATKLNVIVALGVVLILIHFGLFLYGCFETIAHKPKKDPEAQGANPGSGPQSKAEGKKPEIGMAS